MDCHAFVKARPRCAPHGDDDLNKLCNDRKKSVITSDSEVIHIQKFVNFLNNNVAFPTGRLWRAHCVNNSEAACKGLKPLVIRNKDAKNINNNAALAHCVHLQIGCESKTNLLSTSNNSDNLSRSNSSFVINNFKLIQRRIFYESI